jgi:cell division protein FtsL
VWVKKLQTITAGNTLLLTVIKVYILYTPYILLMVIKQVKTLRIDTDVHDYVKSLRKMDESYNDALRRQFNISLRGNKR